MMCLVAFRFATSAASSKLKPSLKSKLVDSHSIESSIERAADASVHLKMKTATSRHCEVFNVELKSMRQQTNRNKSFLFQDFVQTKY
jgi:hypothetical protein